ncbi:MAG TPA: hypothetical protein VGP95_20365 [Gemmatimonadaceae bacterium]|nr:hypothetical protein [Gemmatimonadaceae bacterium]
MTARRQIAGALAIGVLAALIAALLLPFTHGADFAQFHFHARTWLRGGDAYSGGFPVMRATRVVPEPFFYPFPTLLTVAPFALLPLGVAVAAFVGISAALLAYAVLSRCPERLPLFLGSGFFVSLVLGQWSPIITAALIIPALGWLCVLKPNLGLAATAAKPTRVAILGGGALLTATLLIQPNWPFEWLRNLHSMPPHPMPIQLPGGFLLLLALLRWRRPEARLVAAMACVPQLMYFADQLPLWLVARTRREAMMLSAWSAAAWVASLIVNIQADRQPAFSSVPYVLAGVYLPALIMVLLRPNEGQLPEWLERALAKTRARIGRPFRTA